MNQEGPCSSQSVLDYRFPQQEREVNLPVHLFRHSYQTLVGSGLAGSGMAGLGLAGSGLVAIACPGLQPNNRRPWLSQKIFIETRKGENNKK